MTAVLCFGIPYHHVAWRSEPCTPHDSRMTRKAKQRTRFRAKCVLWEAFEVFPYTSLAKSFAVRGFPLTSAGVRFEARNAAQLQKFVTLYAH